MPPMKGHENRSYSVSLSDTLHPSHSTAAHESEVRMISYSTTGVNLFPPFLNPSKNTWLVYYVLKQSVFILEACTLIHLLEYLFTGIFLLAFLLLADATMYLQDTLSTLIL